MLKRSVLCVCLLLCTGAGAQEAFKLLPPAELGITDIAQIDRPIPNKPILSKAVLDTQVFSWPLFYKTQDVKDATAYVEARCSSNPTHAKDAYMSGFLSGLYVKKKRVFQKWLRDEKFSACASELNEAKNKAKFYALMMKNTFPISELSEKNVSDLEGYFYATRNKKILNKLEDLSKTDLETAPAAAKALRTIERADAYEGE